MPLIILLRLLFGALSLAFLIAAGYLLWTWWDGDLVRDVDGTLLRLREDWRLWSAAGLLIWSAVGRFPVALLLARPDHERSGVGDREEIRLTRGEGRQIPGPNGSSLYVETSGKANAPTIVFTHGWGLDSTIWDYAKRDLARDFRLVMWDLPGVGKSRIDRHHVGLESFAAALETVVSETGRGPVFVVGHSIGGMTVQTLARNNPDFVRERIAGIVLLNTSYTNPLETMALSGLAKALRWPVLEPVLWISRWLEPIVWLSAWQSYLSGTAHIANRLGFGRDVTNSQLNATALLGTRNPQGALAKGNLAMFRWDATGALSGLTTPVLVIAGANDIVTKAEASEVITDSAGSATLRIVEGVGHMGFVERSSVYNTAIAKFVEATVQSVDPKSGLRAVQSVPAAMN